MMKFKFTWLLLVLWGPFTVHAQHRNFISVNGKEILGTDGKPFFIRGTNLGNWLVPEGYMFKFKNANSPRLVNEAITELIGPDAAQAFWQKYLDHYITEADIHYLRQLGMNSIRVPFHYRLFTDEDYLGGRGEKRGFALMDRLIKWCKQEGLYLILDMHCAPGGQTGDNIDDSWGYPFLFDNEESQQLAVTIWRKIAQRYKNETTVMGYDLLNEPIAHFFDTAHFNRQLEPLYKRIVKAIREVDTNHLVFLGGAQWDSNFKVFGAPFDDKTVYTFHKYWTPTTQQVIQEYVDFRDRYNVPIYVGETGENSDEWIANFRKLLEQNNIGWHFWPYKKMDSQSAIIAFKVPAYYDQVIQFAEAPKPNFEAIRQVRPQNTRQVQQALEEFLYNCLFEHCTPNGGYIHALGLSSSK